MLNRIPVKKTIVGLSNSGGRKFTLYLSCGHRIICDQSVDKIDKYHVGDMVECSKCSYGGTCGK